MADAITVYQGSEEPVILNPDSDNYILEDPFVHLSSPYLSLPFPSSPNIVLSPRKVNYQPNTLGATTHIYTSPNYDDIINLAAYFGDWACNYDIQEGAIHTITVQVPWDTISNEDFNVSIGAQEVWELLPNAVTKGLLYNGFVANPFVAPSTTGNLVVLPDVYKVAVQQAYENKSSFVTLPPTGSTVYSASFLPFAQAALDYMRFGVEGVPQYGQILRRTACVDSRNTNQYFQTAADSTFHDLNANGNVNYVLSTKGMKAGYSIPTNTIGSFMYPSYVKYTNINGASGYTSGNVYYVTAGWLVKPITWQQISVNKFIITQEFEWGEWLAGLYYVASPVTDFPPVFTPTANPGGWLVTHS